MAYRYRGKVLDVGRPITEEPEAKPTKLPPKPGARCGTTTGYKEHGNYGEEACQPCKTALAEYSRNYRIRVRNGEMIPKAFQPDRCGSYAGYKRHIKRNLPPCKPCLVAHADYMHAWRNKRKST